MTEYCKYCRKSTPHKIIGEGTGEGRGNRELECTICGNHKFLMQGFDLDLM